MLPAQAKSGKSDLRQRSIRQRYDLEIRGQLTDLRQRAARGTTRAELTDLMQRAMNTGSGHRAFPFSRCGNGIFKISRISPWSNPLWRQPMRNAANVEMTQSRPVPPQPVDVTSARWGERAKARQSIRLRWEPIWWKPGYVRSTMLQFVLYEGRVTQTAVMRVNRSWAMDWSKAMVETIGYALWELKVILKSEFEKAVTSNRLRALRETATEVATVYRAIVRRRLVVPGVSRLRDGGRSMQAHYRRETSRHAIWTQVEPAHGSIIEFCDKDPQARYVGLASCNRQISKEWRRQHRRWVGHAMNMVAAIAEREYDELVPQGFPAASSESVREPETFVAVYFVMRRILDIVYRDLRLPPNAKAGRSRSVAIMIREQGGLATRM